MEAPHVESWLQRLHYNASGRAPLPARPDGKKWLEPAAAESVATSGLTSGDADFLTGDVVPESLDWLFEKLFSEQWGFLTQVISSVDAYIEVN